MKWRVSASNLSRYLNFIWQSAPGWTVAGLTLVILKGLLPLVTLFLTKLAVDSVAGTLNYNTIFGFKTVAIFIALLGAATLLEVAATSVDRVVTAIQANILTGRMYEMLHLKSTEVDLEYYESPHYQDTLHRAQQEAPSRPERVLNDVRFLIQNLISVVAVGALMFWLHWATVIVLVIAAIPGVIVRIKAAQNLYAWENRKSPIERQAANLHSMLTTESFAKEIRLFDLGPLFIKRFRGLQSRVLDDKVSLIKKRTLAEWLAMSSAICISFGLLGFLAMRTVNGLMSLGDLVMFYAAVQRGQMLLRQVSSNVGDLYEDNLFLGNLYKFLELESKVKEPSRPLSLCAPLRQGIVFQNVSFHYPGRETLVLDDVVLSIRPGEHIALVGENGAGKTTLAKLLCRLYDPTNGVITLDGIDLQQYAPKDLHRNISVIFQDFGRYQLTARENVWLGNINVPPDGRHLGPAVRKAGVHPVISRLANGYDTVLGNLFEGGQELSAGEWQKIALARAFLHDGDIIVLDEPSNSLDPQAEYEMFERFHQLVKGKTAILISHRLSTVKMVDRIYVLDGGRIAEFGTHNELMNEKRIYARMFETQAERYR